MKITQRPIQKTVINKIPVILLLLVLTSFTYFSKYEFGSLKEKSYYTQLFKGQDLKKLKEAEYAYGVGKTQMIGVNIYFKKADGYRKLIKDGDLSNGKIRRYTRRANRNEKKALKGAFKAYKYFFSANNQIYSVYSKKYTSLKLDDSKEHKLSKIYSDSARIIFSKGKSLKNKAEGKSGTEKYNLYVDAKNKQEEAIKKQEFAFGLYMKDKEIKLPELNKTDRDSAKTTNSKDTTKQNDVANKDSIPEYKPENDKNLYNSKAELIIPKLTLNKEELQTLIDAQNKINLANREVESVNKKYKRIESLRTKAESKTNITEKEELMQKAGDLERSAFGKLVKAANMYLVANKKKYSVYNNHKNDIKSTDNDVVKNSSKYFQNANKLYSISKSVEADAVLQLFISEKYIQLMNANQTLLAAIQEQENAYSVLQGMPVSPIETDMKYKENKSVASYTNNTNTDNTDNANNTNNSDNTKNNDSNKNRNTSVNNNSKNNKGSFKYSGHYVYSAQHPKPRKLINKKGIIFKVQTGVFKYLLPLAKFGKYSPISFDTFKGNKFKRIMVGEYRSTEASEYTLKKVKDMGYKDAFIVGYINGNRVSYKYAKSKIKKTKSYKKTAVQEIIALLPGEKTQKTNNYDGNTQKVNYGTGKYDFAKGLDVKKTRGLIFAVQFGAYQLPRTNKEMKFIRPLLQEKVLTITKYMNGSYNTFAEAESARKEIVKKGFKKAFVVSYFNGKKMSLSKAKKMKTTTSAKVSDKNIFYAVQLGAYASKLAPTEKAKLSKKSPKYTVASIEDKTGLTVYFTGRFNSYAEALKYNKEIGVGYIIAINNFKKISIKKAKELLNN